MSEAKVEPGAEAAEESQAGATEQAFTCDFCGRAVARVRRIALDRDYDRLQKPHAVQYACEDCSEKKERSRLGGDAG